MLERIYGLLTHKFACSLELGAGGGLVGLALALSMTQKDVSLERGHVHLTDQATMLSLMQRNIALNQLPVSLTHASVLDWGAPETNLESPDVILAADCVYFEPAFPLLLQTMEWLIGPRTVCYFCFKKRRRADLRFVKNMKKIFRVEEVDDDLDKGVWSRDALFMYRVVMRS